jgi:PIN domain nuclease of toxin-antitoxin system
MARVLLDTQAVYLAYRNEGLSRTARTVIEDPDTVRIISSVSISEIAIKFAMGKLEMDGDDMVHAIRDLRLTGLAFEPRHALAMFSLPLDHRDLFDRMILATALVEKLPIVTGDRSFPRYPGVKIIW